MSRGTAYYDLPNGERIELPTTMPDVEEVPDPYVMENLNCQRP